MAREQKDNSGVLFQNHKKSSENSPGWKGQGRIDGVDMWISAWVKPGRNDEKFISLAFTPKDKQTVQQKLDQQKPAGDIPF